MRSLAAVGLFGLAACGDSTVPTTHQAALTVIPVLNATDPYALAAAGAVDSLHISLVGASTEAGAGAGAAFTDTVARAAVGIDPITGEARATLTVALFQSPQVFLIILEAVRSADGAVLFQGSKTVEITNGTADGGQQVDIPVAYTGPKAVRLVVTPEDTSLIATGAFTYRVLAFDSASAVVSPQLYFSLVTPADSSLLRVVKLTGLTTAVGGTTGAVRVAVSTPDGAAADTARVYVGAARVGLRATPGYANLGAADTVRFSATVADLLGNPFPTETVLWSSRNPQVAVVDADGLAHGLSVGTAVLVAQSGSYADSVQVTVASPGNVVVSAFAGGRAFGSGGVGDTIAVDVTADLRFTPDELLGSYNGTLIWDPGVLRFVDVLAGDFAAPVVNTAAASDGELRFSAADANGKTGGAVGLARIRFQAVAPGTAIPTLLISELSAAQTFTDLIARVTVTAGSITIRP